MPRTACSRNSARSDWANVAQWSDAHARAGTEFTTIVTYSRRGQAEFADRDAFAWVTPGGLGRVAAAVSAATAAAAGRRRRARPSRRRHRRQRQMCIRDRAKASRSANSACPRLE